MRFGFRLALAPIFCLLAAGCMRTQELPLAPNMVRLDTQASGLIFSSLAATQTLRRAAELTLQNGYSHFRLEQADLSQGSQLAGVYSQSRGTATGNLYSGNASAIYSGSGFARSIYRPTASVGVTVIMFHADEPGAKDAFDAAEVLQRNS